MAIEKGFIKDKNQLFYIPQKKLFFGGMIFLVLAIFFFNFLNFIQFYVILFDSIQNDFEPYFLKGQTKFYYHLILGAISVQFAFSLVYRYVLEAPKRKGQKWLYKRQYAIHQQRAFNWFFIHWFFELGFVLTFFLSLVKGVDFFPEYTYLVGLLLLVFFGQIWMSIRPIVKRRWIWFFSSGIIFLTSSYLVPKVNFTNPEKLQTKLLKNNIIYQNNIHLVESNVFSAIKYSKSRSFDILIPSASGDTIFYEGQKIHSLDLVANIFRSREQFYKWEFSYYTHRLYIDKDVKMSKVFDLKKKLAEIDIDQVSFMFKEPSDDRPFYYKSNIGFSFYIPTNVEDIWESNDPEITSMEIINKTQLVFRKDTLSHGQFRVQLKEHFKATETKSLRIFMKPTTSFETYFKTLESTYYVVMELRNQLAQKSYATDYKTLPTEQRKAIREVHWWHIIDKIKE